MRLPHPITIAATMSALALAGPTALADEAGSKALAAAEAAINKAQTTYLEYEAVTLETGKAEKKLGMNVWIKGDKRLTEFTAPADMKGTKILVLSPTEMYVYLPAFGKVRRITSHTADQGAFGLAFSQDDLSTQRYSPSYAADQSSATDAEIKLTLTPQAGKTTTYPKIRMTIAKDKNVPTQLEYFDAEGKPMKTETRSGYTCEGDVCGAATLKMIDHTKSIATTLTRKKWKVNEAIGDETFSKRNLEK